MRLLGQDLLVVQHQLKAIWLTLSSWLAASLPATLTRLPRRHEPPPSGPQCVSVDSPGGLEKLRFEPLTTAGRARATVGYNVPGCPPPLVDLPDDLSSLAPDLVVVDVHFFSVNYADICARWGLYESALRYVGWPIVVGFDLAGTVRWAGAASGFQAGEAVFGFTLFGAYSSCVIVPGRQLRKVPVVRATGQVLGLDAAAALPAVAATALHAVALSGGWPQPLSTTNRAALVHSAAGGVGSMLLQILKAVGFHPVVGVVGGSHKVEYCRELGADHVIDRSQCGDLWAAARAISPTGYAAIFDANGVDTLAASYEHLSRCGRLITYGFHSNLPKARHQLSPLEWLRMLYRVATMPKFDAMSMVTESKAVLGFNLSFFSEEHDVIEQYFSQLVQWVEEGKLQAPSLVVYDMADIAQAHEAIQSGATIGKLVIRVPAVAMSQ